MNNIFPISVVDNFFTNPDEVVKLANSLKCTPRTIHRHMCNELKTEKENLNNQI